VKDSLHRIRNHAAAAALALAVGCSAVGPDYQRPETPAPAAYKSSLGEWKESEPLDHLPKGAWWEVFGDPALNELETRALESNQDIKAAFAVVNQARAVARVARSEFFPTVNLSPSFQRERFSPNQEPDFGGITVSTYRVPLDLSYEVDLWGRVRRSLESARAEADASLAAFHNLLLTLQADLAQNYFALRALDAEISVLRRAVELRQEQLQIVRDRFDAGLGIELDVARAETELATAEAELANLNLRRAEFENALAILVGEAPPSFRIAPLENPVFEAQFRAPPIPPGLPSTLLERRPDIAEAERQLAADNARIGVAKAGFFPVVRLTGAGGFVSADVESLFNWDARAWSLGPSISLPLFTGGRNRANLRRAEAEFEEAVARYRQRILIAFGEVENSLAGMRLLAEQAEAQERALVNARRARELALESFDAGITDYLGVIDADRAALQNQRAVVQLASQRQIMAVQLIKALGGGWSAEASEFASR
jgi:multidrug efflux system outer membrane protein